jgi:predicted dinucleotide-binding enzyme
VIAPAKEIGFESVDAGHLDASRNIENLGLFVGQPTDQASEIAFRCVLL